METQDIKRSNDPNVNSENSIESLKSNSIEKPIALTESEVIQGPMKKVPVKELAEAYGINYNRLMMKIDFRVVPLLCILYWLAFLDRVNISNAALFGISDDLKLKGLNFNVALAIFFVPYCIFEVPSNALMKKFRPSRWLPACMCAFGLVSTLQGIVQNYSGLLATRFFLGLTEAGMFPGCFYLLSMWYSRAEAQKRYSFFFSSTSLAGGFGGLLASAIGKMDGICGMKGWRWLFIIEGIFTVVVGANIFFLIADFPEEASFLTANEREFIKTKLQQDVGISSARKIPLGIKSILKVFADWKIHAAAMMYFCIIVPAYGYAYFAPTIVKSLGYGSIEAQLHSVPPWAAAFGLSLVTAYFSDKLKHRVSFAIFCQIAALAGLILLLCLASNKENPRHSVQYGGMFLVAAGLYAGMPIMVCWSSMNLAGHHRRAVGTAWQVGFGNLGGFISTFVFPSKDAPGFKLGYSICIAFTAGCILMTLVYLLGISIENKQRKNGKGLEEYNALSDSEKEVRGDLSPYYRYDY